MYNKIKDLLKKVVLGYNNFRYTFSESGEDMILQRIFINQMNSGYNGFYVDVGAYHPFKASTTQLLYLNGWKGINLDPKPGMKQLFDKYRKRDINLQMAVTENKCKVPYYFSEVADSLNGIDYNQFVKLNIENRIRRTIEVNGDTLASILDTYLPDNKCIDYLNIDVEGYDLQVLESNNWEKYSPNIISVEISGSNIQEIIQSKVYNYLIGKDYIFLAKTYIVPNVSTCFFKNNGNLEKLE